MLAHSVARWRCICALVLIANAVQVRQASADDTFEPNDTIETAAPIGVGVPLMSYVSTSGDVDYYQFTVPSWQQLRFDLTVPDAADYLIQVVLGIRQYRLRRQHWERPRRAPGAHARRGDVLRQDQAATAGPLGTTHDPVNPYTLAFSVLDGDVLEPNNTHATATELPLGTPVSAYVFTTRDNDYYRIVVPADGHLHITLEVPDTAQYNILLVQQQRRTHRAARPNPSGWFLPAPIGRSVTTVRAGTYVVVVQSAGAYTQTEPYVIRALAGHFYRLVRTEQPARREARPIASGTLSSKTYTRNDEDWYRFSVSAAGTVILVLEVPPSLDLGSDRLYQHPDFDGVTSNATGNGIDEYGHPAARAWHLLHPRLQASTLIRRPRKPIGSHLAGNAVRPLSAVPADFDGDRVADPTVYRPSTGTWQVRNQFAVQFGEPGDIPVSGDYNGDGLADVAVYRPSTGTWYVRNQFAVQFGDRGDIPVPGDYNDDGITDIAVYRPATGYWFVRNQLAVQYGDRGDLPVPADYNGDGAVDLAVYRPATGDWFVRQQFVARFGEPGDVPVPGDYDGDGRAELAVYRTPSGHWLLRNRLPVRIGGAGFRPVPADFNNDGATDMAVYELSTGVWTVIGSISFAHESNTVTFTFGEAGDVPVPHRALTLNRAAHDFDGDGTTDAALYRPSTGEWLVHNRPTTQYRDAGDRPVPADYNRDGVVDVAVYRPSTGMWFVRNQFAVQFGDPSDVPIPGDYNGDGAADVAVYRPSTGTWYVRNQFAVQFGDPNDIPVPGDYNGDGVTDIAVYRPSTGMWYVRNQLAVRFGEPGDVVVPADYDGNGRIDIAVYRPSTTTWHVRNQFSVSFGTASDIPVPGDYNGDGRADLGVYKPATRQWDVVNQFRIEFGNAGDVPLVRGAWTP